MLAWRIVNIWARTKAKGRMPTLRSMLRSTGRDTRPPSHAQQRAVLDVLSAQYGVALRRVRLG
jgi:hypothetical protein